MRKISFTQLFNAETFEFGRAMGKKLRLSLNVISDPGTAMDMILASFIITLGLTLLS